MTRNLKGWEYSNISDRLHQKIITLLSSYFMSSIYIKANVSEWVSEYVCVLLGSGGVFFGVRPVAVINKIKYTKNASSKLLLACLLACSPVARQRTTMPLLISPVPQFLIESRATPQQWGNLIKTVAPGTWLASRCLGNVFIFSTTSRQFLWPTRTAPGILATGP
jgi:hypothetical protein